VRCLGRKKTNKKKNIENSKVHNVFGGKAILYLSSFFLVRSRANSPVPPHRMAESTWSDRLPWGILFPHTDLRRSFCVSPETWVFSSSIETRLSVRRTPDVFQAFGLFGEKSPSGQWNVHRSLKASLGTVRVVNVNHQKSQLDCLKTGKYIVSCKTAFLLISISSEDQSFTISVWIAVL